MIMKVWVRGILIGLMVVFSPLSNAADENFDVYVFANTTYDDNVFRIANSAEALAQNGTTTQDDIEITYGVGANIKIPVSRQQFNFDAELRRTNFDRFSQLNNNNGRFDGEWQWALASRASGTLGYKYERRLTDFFEFQSAIRDTEVDQNFYGRANIPVHRRWTLVVGAESQDVSFSERQFLDRDTATISGEVLFETRAKTFVGVRVRESATEFDDNFVASNDFDESEYGIVVRWDASGHSRFSGSLSRTDRDPDNPASGDFSGGTWDLDYRRFISGKTYVDFSVFRETTLLNEVAGLVVSKGAEVIPLWNISPKLSFRGQLRYEQRDFEAAVLNSGRSDDLLTIAARFNYRLNRAFSLNLGVSNRSRSSNIDNTEFDQTELSVGLRLNI